MIFNKYYNPKMIQSNWFCLCFSYMKFSRVDGKIRHKIRHKSRYNVCYEIYVHDEGYLEGLYEVQKYNSSSSFTKDII